MTEHQIELSHAEVTRLRAWLGRPLWNTGQGWSVLPNGSLTLGRVTFEAVEGGRILVRTQPYEPPLFPPPGKGILGDDTLPRIPPNTLPDYAAFDAQVSLKALAARLTETGELEWPPGDEGTVHPAALAEPSLVDDQLTAAWHRMSLAEAAERASTAREALAGIIEDQHAAQREILSRTKTGSYVRAPVPERGDNPREESIAGMCPDDGACHHGCSDRAHCFRVEWAGPLSAYGERWTDDDLAGHLPTDGTIGG